MATIKKSKVTVTVSGIISILLITAWLLVPATQAEAKTVKYKIIAPLTRVEWIAVPDVERHSVVLY